MKNKRYREKQIIGTIKEYETGAKLDEICDCSHEVAAEQRSRSKTTILSAYSRSGPQ